MYEIKQIELENICKERIKANSLLVNHELKIALPNKDTEHHFGVGLVHAVEIQCGQGVVFAA